MVWGMELPSNCLQTRGFALVSPFGVNQERAFRLLSVLRHNRDKRLILFGLT
jgi:hypothetical protein